MRHRFEDTEVDDQQFKHILHLIKNRKSPFNQTTFNFTGEYKLTGHQAYQLINFLNKTPICPTHEVTPFCTACIDTRSLMQITKKALTLIESASYIDPTCEHQLPETDVAKLILNLQTATLDPKNPQQAMGAICEVCAKKYLKAHFDKLELALPRPITGLVLQLDNPTSKEIHTIAIALSENKTLTDVTLKDCAIFPEGNLSLIQILKHHKTLSSYRLENVGINSIEIMKELSMILLLNQSLTTLSLTRNPITWEMIHDLMIVLGVNRRITAINLSHNLIDDKAIDCCLKHLAQRNPTLLATLNLEGNQFSTDYRQIIAKLLLPLPKTVEQPDQEKFQRTVTAALTAAAALKANAANAPAPATDSLPPPPPSPVPLNLSNASVAVAPTASTIVSSIQNRTEDGEPNPKRVKL